MQIVKRQSKETDQEAGLSVVRILRKKNSKATLHRITHENGVTYLSFDSFSEATGTRHAFATRLGGVSRAPFDTMNLSFTRGDDPDAVTENYRRITQVMGRVPDDVVCTFQTHTAHVRKVTREDAGKGVTRDRDYTDTDGLVTDEEGVVLACFWADCVPLLFADPVRRAIGVAHAGRRGTTGGIGKKMVEAMHAYYGTDAADLHVAIGPSICADCYEIGTDVAEEVSVAFPGAKETGVLFQKEDAPRDKYQLDLWLLNSLLLREAGVRSDRITVTDICTRCNPDLLFSHRVRGEARGNLAAFLTLA